MQRKLIVASLIVLGGMFAAGGVLGISQNSGEHSSTQWTQSAGLGTVVPACGSSSIGSITCQSGAPSVPFSWSTEGESIYYVTPSGNPTTATCTSALINVNGVTIASSLPCTGSFTWYPATNNAALSYEIRYQTIHVNCVWDPENTYCIDGDYDTTDNHLVSSGTFTTPQCQAPTVDVKANDSDGPLSVNPGSVTISWSATNAPTSCTASGSWSGTKAASGSEVVTVTAGTSNSYALSCTNFAGTAADSVTVSASAIPTPTGSIFASPNPCSIASGQTTCTSYITWESSNASSPTVTRQSSAVPEAVFSTSASCSGTSCPAPWIDATGYLFKLYSSYPGGSVLAQINVTGTPPGSPPATFDYSLSIGSMSIIQGSSATNRASATLISGTTQPVSFSVSGLPNGVTAYFSSDKVAESDSTTSEQTGLARLIKYATRILGLITVHAGFSPSSCNPMCSTDLTLTASPTVSPGTYTITVKGTSTGVPDKTSSFNLTVTTSPAAAPTADIKANSSNGPVSVSFGQSATLSWGSTNATSCSVTPGGWSGTSNSGQTTGPITSDTTYTLSCSGTGGSASDPVTVNVDDELGTSCNPSPSPASVGRSVTWTANPFGGTGSYTYSWSDVFPSGGTELTGTTKSVTKAYTSAGTKSAYVTITSGAQSGTFTCNSLTVYQPTLVITPARIDGSVGQSAQLTALYDADGPSGSGAETGVTGTASWTSDDPTIVSVDNSGTGKGTVTAVAPGTTIVRAAYTDAYGNALVATAETTVGNGPPIADAKISTDGSTYSDEISVARGVPTTIFLSSADSSDPNGWRDANYGVSDGGKCEWNSNLSQDDPATFETTIANPGLPGGCNTSLGTLTFNDTPGTYTYEILKITDKAGGVSNIDTVTVTVFNQPVLYVDPVAFTVGRTSQNNTYQLQARYDPDGPGGPLSPQFVTSAASWSSNNGFIATVGNSGSTNGKVTGNLAGNTTISASYTDTLGTTVTAQSAVTVITDPPLACSPVIQEVLVNTNASLSAIGGAFGSYSWSAPGGTPSTGSLKSFTPKYASTETYTATVTNGSETADCIVSVVDPTYRIDPSTANLSAGGTFALRGWYDADGAGPTPEEDLTDFATWSSSKTSIATVTNGTAPRGVVTGVSAGSATITSTFAAFTKTVSGTSAITVIVEPPLSCSPASQDIFVGQTGSFSSAGGSGTYSWSAAAGSPSSGTGSSFNARFDTPATPHTVSVSSGVQAKSCLVNVYELPAPQCSDSEDNDGDTKTDYPADPGCSSADDTDETDPPPGAAPIRGFREVAPNPKFLTPDAITPRTLQNIAP